MAGYFHGGHGQSELERGAVSETAFNGDLATERFDQAAHQGKTQARAFLGRRAEPVKDGAQALGFDAATIVANRELHKVLYLLSSENNFAPLGREAKGIGEQVVEDGAKGASIGAHVGEIGVGVYLNADVFLRRWLPVAVARLAQHGKRLQVLEVEVAFAYIDFRHFDQVAHQVVELFRLLAGGGHQLRL